MSLFFKRDIKRQLEKIEKLKQIPQNANDVKQAYFKGLKKGLEVALFLYKEEQKVERMSEAYAEKHCD